MSEITDLKTLHDRAGKFSKLFESSTYEMGESQKFITGLCDVYGISAFYAPRFEERVKKDGGGINRIDALFNGLMLVEMKSAGENLEKAYQQAKGYVEKLKNRADILPRYIFVSDFQNLVLYDTQSNEPDTPITRFKLSDFRQHVEELDFLSGYEHKEISRQEAANIAAASQLGKLHEAIKASDYRGDGLEKLLVRILFCLFGDDTYLFGEPDVFLKLVNESRSDGEDLNCILDRFFSVLNAPKDKRSKSYNATYQALPYVNGELFSGRLDDHCFTSDARAKLLECCKIDWSEISPAIFGTLFQTIMHHEGDELKSKDAKEKTKRRELGAHYTSETNILKVIAPLFLDGLKVELEKAIGNKNKLNALHAKLRELTFFDPACGCGNFLVIAYRELRLLEERVLNELEKLTRQSRDPVCDVDQFYGIEIDSTSAQIAIVAMWITDHQMNLRLKERENPYLRLPLKHRANVVCANALQLDWHEIIAPKDCHFIMGNPPFVGHQWRNAEQMRDMDFIWGDKGKFGRLDFVACWHKKATDFIKSNPNIPVAFVSTNSICQGEQVGILWAHLLEQGVKIHFAHRTFRWNNEAGDVAAVHCVIIGFGLKEPVSYRLFDYIHTKVEDKKTKKISTVTKIKEIKAAQINPYLVDAPNVILPSRIQPPAGLPKLTKGSQPTDGGHLILTEEEKTDLLVVEPKAEKWIKPYIGGEELINGSRRYCLWLKEISPAELKAMPHVLSRLENVRKWRLTSATKSVQECANQPALFTQDRQPTVNYLALPTVSSENRKYIPIAFLSSEIIASNQIYVMPNAELYHFGVITSMMHNSWTRTVCGRMKSDYRYSPSVYNNFPFPVDVKPAAKKKIEDAAQAVLEARAVHKDKSLADLYNPKTMPENLADAHVELDKAVDAAYSYGRNKKDDASRVAFLFEKYQELIEVEQK